MGGPVLESKPTLDGAIRIRRRLLAVCLPLTAALYLIGESLTPSGLDTPITDTATALRMLLVAQHSAPQLYISNMLVVFGSLTFAFSFLALATLVPRRGARFATIAAPLGALACFCAALGNLLVGFNLAVAATANMTQQDAAHFLTTSFNSVPGGGFVFAEAIPLPIAIILMAVALWRSRAVPRWLPVLFVISWPLAVLAPPGALLTIPLMLPFAVAMVLLARAIWRSASLSA